jgi:hypothetical protein
MTTIREYQGNPGSRAPLPMVTGPPNPALNHPPLPLPGTPAMSVSQKTGSVSEKKTRNYLQYHSLESGHRPFRNDIFTRGFT